MSDVTMELAKEANDKAMQIARLKAENDRLRESVKRLMTQRDERLARAETDNAKLRKLVRGLHKALFSLNLDHCQACPREDACVFVHKSFDCNECAFERDMRELGVEVDA